jgi:hypothetical protein
MKLNQKTFVSVVRKREISNKLDFTNPIILEHYRGGVLLGKHLTLNGITNEGKNLILDVMFNDVTPIANASWFIGLISLAGFTALAAADVMNSHGGWTEYINYSQATRVAWGSGVASSQVTTNASPATFNINGAGGTVKGVFITSNSTKSGITGKLWSTALFGADVPVTSGDELKITYSVSA